MAVVFADVCAHRLILSPKARIAETTAKDVLAEVVQQVRRPTTSERWRKIGSFLLYGCCYGWQRGHGAWAIWPGGILLASALCAAAEIAAACALRKRLTAQLSAAVSCRKGEELPVTVTVANSGLLSCLRVQADVQCRNLLTGEVTHAAACLPAGGTPRPRRYAPSGPDTAASWS